MKNKKDKKDKSALEIQQEVDEWRNNLKTSMVSEEKSKHDAVEKAINILSQAKVPAYLYVDLPNPDYPIGVPCIFQFNTVVGMVDYDKNGEISKVDEYVVFFMNALLKAIFEHYTIHSNGAIESGIDKLDPTDPKSFSIRMEYMNYCIYLAYKQYQDKVKEIIDESK